MENVILLLYFEFKECNRVWHNNEVHTDPFVNNKCRFLQFFRLRTKQNNLHKIQFSVQNFYVNYSVLLIKLQTGHLG